jgi:hypothetical protein
MRSKGSTSRPMTYSSRQPKRVCACLSLRLATWHANTENADVTGFTSGARPGQLLGHQRRGQPTELPVAREHAAPAGLAAARRLAARKALQVEGDQGRVAEDGEQGLRASLGLPQAAQACRQECHQQQNAGRRQP